MRIVSLLPSATEIVCALGLEPDLVGVSHECDFPDDIGRLPTVTSSMIDKYQSSRQIDEQVRQQLQTSTALYTLDLELLESLRPDLIVTQALCDVCAVSANDVEYAIQQLPGKPHIINLEPANLADVIDTVERVGVATERVNEAQRLIQEMRERSARVRETCRNQPSKPRVVCLEWLDPPFNAGHWTPELVELAGGISVTGVRHQPSHTITWQDIAAARPDILFIACCGFSVERTLEDLLSLDENHELRNLACWRNKRVFVADGNHYFNRPGPRLIDSLEILADAFHPRLGLLSDRIPAAIRIDTERIGL